MDRGARCNNARRSARAARVSSYFNTVNVTSTLITSPVMGSAATVSCPVSPSLRTSVFVVENEGKTGGPWGGEVVLAHVANRVMADGQIESISAVT